VPHVLLAIGDKTNNKAPIRANSDSISALVEGTTNGHDAVTRLWTEQGWFATKPKSVEDALTQIAGSSARPKPQVYMLVQLAAKSKFSKAHAVTIGDVGIGMTARAMRDGVLTFGSEDKVLDKTQFGSFGQGSASLFGHCKFSIIASRRAGTNTVVFTAVWLNKPAGRIHSYVYLTKPDGSLFEFEAGTLSDSVSLTKVTPSLLRDNVPIVPVHGTIRRQLEIDGVPEYFSQRGDSLYYALNDRLFGCPGWVQMMGDDDPGHHNNRRGRRWEFNSVAIGQKLPRSNWTMMGHVEPVNVMLHRRDEKVGLVQLESWVISSYRTKPTEKNPKGEFKSPARHLLEGSDRAAPRNILVTLNGQTLARLHSTSVFAKYRSIAENIIIEAKIDFLPEDTLQDAEVYLSNRDGLEKRFERALLEEIKRFVEDQPEFERLADEMMPPEEPATVDNTFNVEINRVMNDPILGRVFGFQTVQVANKVGPGDDIRVKRDRKPTEKIKLVDPPTWLEIRKETVVRNGTNWLTLHTDAPDSYAKRLVLVLPPFLSQIGPATLQKGRMTVGVDCDNSALGTTGTISARLRDTKLADERLITIVPRKTTPKKQAMKPGLEQRRVERQGPPETKLLELDESSSHWGIHFSAACDPTKAAINYFWDTEKNQIVVALHTRFPVLLTTQQRLERRFGPLIARDFYRRVCQQVQINAMIFCRNELLNAYSADADGLEVMCDMMRAIIVSAGTLYRIPAFRNAVLSGNMVSDDE
jgi:hypothetical protein